MEKVKTNKVKLIILVLTSLLISHCDIHLVYEDIIDEILEVCKSSRLIGSLIYWSIIDFYSKVIKVRIIINVGFF